jgi:phosphoglycerate dehydrogenase-like enzyme
MKIVMIGEAARHQAEIARGLSEPASFVALPRDAQDSAGWDDQIEGADVLVAMRLQRTGQAPRVRLLQVPGAGLDGIDLGVLPVDCRVCNVFEHEIPMAEYALACLLDHEVRLGAARATFDSQRWSQAYLERQPRGELHGKTLVILGFGRIGQAVAQRARAFGMRILAITRSACNGQVPAGADAALPPAALDEALGLADYVVLVCPLDERTRGCFGTAQFAAMRPHAVLLNLARAAVVDEDALHAALVERRIAKAYLDVWYRYPSGEADQVAPARERFEDLANAFCTPHISGWTQGLFARRYAFIAANIERLRRGEPLLNQVHGPR